ncbi:TPA: hypothetical protein IP915_001276 [Listeria monocytogenes]|uniref:hypothetical protein n=1 Tax=Listeria monocytogenes TaxID=1639 RepID=UPI0010B889C6|nr:hypothetical protein [Listeria monocytogenes]EAC4202107.1 hypothetical protein [Listeria monocytogenes]EBF5159887.1 hypothetical protein [Listeria monocytogenes]EKB5972300.1 hypothetical protein [Listeria monocytogenes]TYU50039.1 hypothetical protein FZW86_01335 [Listeria monocytogenes]HAA6513721.1 hypothetical protein [Listeria monocytogenes]
MDKQRQLLLKLENLDDAFNRKRRQLDEAMDDASQEKWRFNQELENLSEKIRYIYQKRDYDVSEDLPKAYHLISSIQEEGEWMVKNTVTHLENESEEHQILYKKQVTAYEEELHQLKKERD